MDIRVNYKTFVLASTASLAKETPTPENNIIPGFESFIYRIVFIFATVAVLSMANGSIYKNFVHSDVLDFVVRYVSQLLTQKTCARMLLKQKY